MKEKLSKNLIAISMVVLGAILMISHILTYCPSQDSYFLINLGKEIVENGYIPYENIWISNSGLKIVCGQWLCAVLNYCFYKAFGMVGPIVMGFATDAIAVLLLYILTGLSKTSVYERIIATTIAVVYLLSAITNGAEGLLFILIMLLLIIMERYKASENLLLVFVSFFLSVLIVNYQAIGCIGTIMIPLVYFACEIIRDVKNKKINVKYNIGTLCFAVVNAAGLFINPYGKKSVLYAYYMFKTPFAKYLRLSVQVLSVRGVLIILSIIGIAYAIYKKKISLEWSILGILAVIISLFSGNLAWIIAPVIAVSYGESIQILQKYRYAILAALICIGIVIIYRTPANIKAYRATYTYPNVLKALTDVEAKDSSIYTSTKPGNYLSFYGFTPYTVGYSEYYAKIFNESENLINAHYPSLIVDSSADYRFIIFQFDYLVVEKGSYLDYYLYHNHGYRLLAEDENVNLWERI